MKINISILVVIAIVCFSALVNSCRKSGGRRFPAPDRITITLPQGFPEPVYSLENNPVTLQGVTLGRRLFYDSKLSLGIDVTCGSCHQQNAGFTQFDHDLGHGTNHQHTTRNPPGIFNMIWSTSFKWDGSIATLPEMVGSCLTATEKMGDTYPAIVDKLKTESSYRTLFGEAFGDEEITAGRINSALTQFVATIISADSKYDKVKRGEATFNASEQQGYDLFKTKCASCHQEPLFTDFSFRNVGLEVSQFHPDHGRMEFTGNAADSNKFKVPSLRNVGLTGYFTHDGRFPEFTQMIEHYSSGIIQSPGLDPSLQNGIPLSNLEKFYLQEFLYTLTDSSMAHDPKFANF